MTKYILRATEISGLRDPIYDSGAASKHYVDNSAGSFDATLYMTSSNIIANYANSGVLLGKYYPSTLGMGVSSAVNLNTTHRTSDGSNHTFIDQDVTNGSTPTFGGTNFTIIPQGALKSGAEYWGAHLSGQAAVNEATSPLSIAGTTVSIQQADTDNSGYLSDTDWTTFNNKSDTAGVPGATISSNFFYIDSGNSLWAFSTNSHNLFETKKTWITPTEGTGISYNNANWGVSSAAELAISVDESTILTTVSSQSVSGLASYMWYQASGEKLSTISGSLSDRINAAGGGIPTWTAPTAVSGIQLAGIGKMSGTLSVGIVDYIASANVQSKFIHSGVILNAVSANTLATTGKIQHIGDSQNYIEFQSDGDTDIYMPSAANGNSSLFTLWDPSTIGDSKLGFFEVRRMMAAPLSRPLAMFYGPSGEGLALNAGPWTADQPTILLHTHDGMRLGVQTGKQIEFWNGLIDSGYGGTRKGHIDPATQEISGLSVLGGAYVSSTILHATTVSCATYNGPSIGETPSAWTWATPTATSGLSLSNTGKVSGNLAI